MNICLDACFIIGLYDSGDRHHQRSRVLFEEYFGKRRQNQAIIVWPALYESVSTKMVRDPKRVQSFESDWRSLESNGRLGFVDDGAYRQEALALCFDETSRQPSSYRRLSLTDRVIRAAIMDINVRIDALITFNAGDFWDVCQSTGKELLC